MASVRDTVLLPADRHRKIVTLVDREGSVRATELARMFSVTQETIRLDLEKLESEGLLVRKHGGAVTLRALTPEIPFHERRVALAEEKSAIARKAISLIQEGDTILLDASSTVWQLTRLLPDIPLTIVTPAIKVIVQLANHRNVRVISTGGTLSAASLSLVGPQAERSIGEYHVDKVFISCAGVDFRRGLSESHEWQAALKLKMLEHASLKVLLVDHSKFNVRSLSIFGDVRKLDRVITDDKVDPNVLEELRKREVLADVASIKG